MMNDSLEALLIRLNAGDQLAIEQMFVAFEPYMRMAIHRHVSGSLRAKFDSTDVVQSVWADLVDGLHHSKWTFESLDQFRAFLLKTTRNRFIDRVRRHRKSLRREVSLSPENIDALPADRCPRVSENFYADELWQQMLEACPSAHYDLLMLKHQGASIAEIAERANLHKSSVRRILYDLAKRVTRLRQTAVV
jgi:RNA polymerase sigma factor (sigma-70 family)